MDKLELIPVEDLLNKNFFIPSYQRGYRWKERQVIDLLDDILEFQDKGKQREDGEFYCLQPLVVTKLEEKGEVVKWEVIDGQQRLTTLFLILKYLDILVKEEYQIENLYTIEYATRQESWEYLDRILENVEINTENPDYYHISLAFQTITEWFDSKIKDKENTKRFSKRQYLENFMLTDIKEKDGKNVDIANNIRFIWYEVLTENEEQRKNIFTRINMGKIPLSNAELIKALFFINGSQSDKEKEKYQNKLAYEWDNIENSLQDIRFWFFLNKSDNLKPTKIEFIFDLIANKYQDRISIEINKSIDKYYTFYVFNNLINIDVKTKDELWEEIKTYYRTFEEWFKNNEYYHLIGYLIHIGKDIEGIKKLSNGISKSAFKNRLIELIKKDIILKFNKANINTLIELSYQDNGEIISDVLLLFNVISTMNSKYSKFPFERYINEKWSLEHIHAQNSEDLNTDKQRFLLLEEQKLYFQNSNEDEILNKINTLLEESKINLDSFINLQNEIFNKYTDNDIMDIHSINNMALLSINDNSALNNNIFPIKRDKIIELDKKGSFIPICTKNVFLKFYSKDVMQNLEWTKKDREAYLSEIKKTLNAFLPDGEWTNETKYSFWELLNCYKIEIPKIQRDYAHGRSDSKIAKIALKFLDDIKNSILNSEELNLDFVYGRVDNKTLIPLDGQQRLTTLFLIHWYIALKEDKLTDEIKIILLKFIYETRISSEDFCKNLITENINYKSITKKISNVITDSRWYFLSWELDPTVSAMLNMLDLIHEKFKNVEEPMFDKLISKQETNIIFQFLPLEQFKLTDELYIKMNARGKPSQKYESFKAGFSKYLQSLEQKSKLDNEWLDIFWNLEKNRHKEIVTENIDNNIYNFFKNVTLNFYAEANVVDINYINNYNLFDTYKYVYKNKEYVSQVKNILNGLINYDDTYDIFKDFLSLSINYYQRLRFYSLSQFFVKYGSIDKHNKDILDKWLRVTKNLINNTLIQSAANFKEAVLSIKDLSRNIDDINTYVSYSSDNIKYFLKLQRDEEGLKSRLILDNVKWEKLFIKTEQHSYFDGQIGFILQYAKNDDSTFDKVAFENYSIKLSKIFSTQFRERSNFLFQRALLTKGNYLPQVGNSDNYTFCVFEEAQRTKLDNWRKVFNDNKKTLLLKELLDNIGKEQIGNDLKYIIENHNVSDWRKLIIENPSYISYCKYRQIRWYSKDTIYLLSKGQMNGRHVELFSWDLFKLKFEKRFFNPFSDESWYWESISWDRPCIVIESYKYKENLFAIEISYENNKSYAIQIFDRNETKMPNEVIKLLEDLHFEQNKIVLPENKIEDKLKEICSKIETLSNL